MIGLMSAGKLLNVYAREKSHFPLPLVRMCPYHADRLSRFVADSDQEAHPRIGRVQRKKDGVRIVHVNGVDYDHHYVVVADGEDGEVVLDPFLPPDKLMPVPRQEYFSAAYANPQDVEWASD